MRAPFSKLAKEVLDDSQAAKSLQEWLDSGQAEGHINLIDRDGPPRTIRVGRPAPSITHGASPLPAPTFSQQVRFCFEPLIDFWPVALLMAGLICSCTYTWASPVNLLTGALRALFIGWGLIGALWLVMLGDMQCFYLDRSVQRRLVGRMHIIWLIGLIVIGAALRYTVQIPL